MRIFISADFEQKDLADFSNFLLKIGFSLFSMAGQRRAGFISSLKDRTLEIYFDIIITLGNQYAHTMKICNLSKLKCSEYNLTQKGTSYKSYFRKLERNYIQLMP